MSDPQDLQELRRDALRYRALKARHRYLIVVSLIGAKGYSSVKADQQIDAFADAAVAEVAAWDALTTEQKSAWREAELARAKADAARGKE